MRTQGLDLSSPLGAYTASWGGVLVLSSLRLTTQLEPIGLATIVLVVGNVLSFIAIYVPLSYYFPAAATERRFQVPMSDVYALRRFVRLLTAVWIVGSVCEIVIARGVPMLWILVGDTSRDYRNFGVPSFHGMMMALYMFVVVANFADYQITGRRRAAVTTLAMLAWPVILINRAAAVLTLFEMAGCYVVLRRLTWRQIGMMVVLAVVGILAFGVIGDLRLGTHRRALALVVTPGARPLFDTLPSGFLWAYIYVTSPINNVTAAIANITPSYVPYYSTMAIFPTVLRDALLGFGEHRYALGLVNEAFNTSTFYANFLADFGTVGAWMIVAMLQAFVVYLYLHARRGRLWGVLGYAVLFQAVVVSAFTDTFTTLATIAQVLLALYLRFATAQRPYNASEREYSPIDGRVGVPDSRSDTVRT